MFEKVKKNLGFGCMRLPLIDGKVDNAAFIEMIDTFMENGFNYFDTAHGYLSGQSEVALRECLTSRYPRESYVLTNKLSSSHFNDSADIRPLFEKQLKICGVEYFDFYLMHAQDKNNFVKYQQCSAYETAFALKKEGRIKHVGISFHDKAEVLEMILTQYPQIEVVQIQFNYLDYENPSVESRRCYEVCRKYNKPILIMEPVKGGRLVELPEAAQRVFDGLNGGSNASYAIRFAASFPGVFMVLSGMGNMDMINDNCGYMKNFRPLDEMEMSAVERVRQIICEENLIPCTACRYCTDGCPQGIPIPDLFACMNTKKQFDDWNASYYYHDIHTKNGGKASTCIGCGSCESVCPQHLDIRKLLADVAETFEK